MLLNELAVESDLEECLSAPSAADIETCRRLQGDIIVLGAAGKMGPSLVHRIVRASDAAGTTRRVIAVSRYSSPAAREEIERAGGIPISADLLDPAQVAELPDCPNVLFLAGRKFGSADDTALTWAINTMVPAICARRFSSARIVAFSTGNVYPFVPVTSGGSLELDQVEPRGEYAQSCLGRERIFEYFSRHHGTPTVIYRLNYAVDLRYGVLVDIARKVLGGQPIDLTVSHVNAIWQGDANSYALRALEGCTSPARVLNVTGPELLPVVDVAGFFGRHFGVPPIFTGEASGEALLNNASNCHEWLGRPEVSANTLMTAVAHWLQHGGRTLDKPTKFEVTSGKF